MCCIFLIAAVAPGFAFLDFPSDASVQAGVYKHWNDLALTYAIDPVLSLAAQNAFAAWGCENLTFTQAPYPPVVNSRTNCANASQWEGPAGVGVGANIDVMSRPGNFSFMDYYGNTRTFNNALAFTAPVAISGDIVSVDIFINSDYTGFDTQTIVLHEIGHALGLDHPDQAVANGAADYDPVTFLPGAAPSPADVMYSLYTGVKRNLTADEIGGLYFIYPKPGDANRDGVVDISDLAILAANYGQRGTWKQGDFNGDCLVDVSDLAILSGTYANFVPEPSVFFIFFICLYSISTWKANS